MEIDTLRVFMSAATVECSKFLLRVLVESERRWSPVTPVTCNNKKKRFSTLTSTINKPFDCFMIKNNFSFEFPFYTHSPLLPSSILIKSLSTEVSRHTSRWTVPMVLNLRMRLYHRLYGSTSCCISHGPCQWERAIFDPPQLRDPWTVFHETWNI